MIPAMAMVTSSVEPQRRGAFLSAHSSGQHVASGLGAHIGRLIIVQAPTGRIEHFGNVSWIAVVTTLLSLWLAGRIVSVPTQQTVSAEALCIAAAAEAAVDVGEPPRGCSHAASLHDFLYD
jgi:MFS transporter, DHA1 family, inner membrane transport protein